MFEGSFSESRISFSIWSSEAIFAESSWSTMYCVSDDCRDGDYNGIPWPSFSSAALVVENAAYLGIEDALHVC